MFAPVTAVVALLAWLGRSLIDPLPMGWIVTGTLALNLGLLIAMTVFGWQRRWLDASGRQVKWISTITALLMNPLALVAPGVVGLLYDEDRWGLHMTILCVGGLLFTALRIGRRSRNSSH